MNKRRASRKRKPPTNPCPICTGETATAVIYSDGTETRRCYRRRCGALTSRSRTAAAQLAA